jgi:hypothetical protein
MADLSWAIPVMRAGYAGRGVTYLAVAGLSLWAIWRGGEAQGTSAAIDILATEGWGIAVLWIIGIGLLCYALWRLIDAAKDLEDYGSDGKGAVARVGMVTTGLIHGALGLLAIGAAFGDGSSGGGGGVSGAVARVLDWPFGLFLVWFAAICTLGAGLYYIGKGWKASYRKHLRANLFTTRYDLALRAGVISQGIVVLVIGGFLVAAALAGNSTEAGGVGQVFDWLANQPFGNLLVILLCLGLLGFAFFCFVNAAYRIIPKVAGDDVSTLAAKVKAAAT